MRKQDECEHEHWRPAIFLFIFVWLPYFLLPLKTRIDVPCLPHLFLSSSVQCLPPVALIVQERLMPNNYF